MVKEKVVLVIEDSRTMAMAMKQMLEGLGYIVQIGYDGREGVSLFNRYLPDLVFMDIELPGINGFEALAKIKESGSVLSHSAPVIMLTGKQSKTDVLNAVKAGASDYLVKPVTAELLSAKLKKFLE